MIPHESRRRQSRVERVASSIFLLLLVTNLLSCRTAPKSEPTVFGTAGSAEGQWRGKALVRDLKNGQSAVLDLDVLAREPAQMRMEITGSFGVHVASVALDGSEIRFLLPREKRFIIAPAGSSSFSRLIPVRIPPLALMAVLFDRRMPADWSCQSGPESTSQNVCTHRREKVSVRWLERNGRNRRLKIQAAEAEVEMVLDEAKSKVEMNSDAFRLSPPDGYKQERTTSN